MLLSWSHYRALLQVKDKAARDWYEKEAAFIKNPVVAEFLGFAQNTDFTESDLEKSILSNLQKFLMELGKGYAFVARQQHIHTEKQDYYIDLVFLFICNKLNRYGILMLTK